MSDAIRDAVEHLRQKVPDWRTLGNSTDDYLKHVLKAVEHLLSRVCTSIIVERYRTDAFGQRFIAAMFSRRGWYVAWQCGVAGEAPVALLSAPWGIRREAFSPVATHGPVEPLTPIELLVSSVLFDRVGSASCAMSDQKALVTTGQRIEAAVVDLVGTLR